jgi:hypothetical protein
MVPSFCFMLSFIEPAIKVAIAAVIISLVSSIVAIIGCIIAIKSYKKSIRTEFFQRRDLLFQTIAELSIRNSEGHLISARYEMVAQNLASLRLDGENAERIKNQIASIKRAQENLDLRTKHWAENIDALHSKCSSFTFKTDTERIERVIAMVQVASDRLKRDNEGFHSFIAHTRKYRSNIEG